MSREKFRQFDLCKLMLVIHSAVIILVMSGHSKWSTIKRKKEATDHARGKLFSKLSKNISVAVKTGGGIDPSFNPKLRMAVDTAKAANMPKSNIERAISRAGEVGDINEVEYEGFGPGGIQVIIMATTDNKNRTGQELKTILDRAGGSMGGPNSVSFNFDTRGYFELANKSLNEEDMLKVIDAGAEDIKEYKDYWEVYTSANNLKQVVDKLNKEGYETSSMQIVKKPKTTQKITESEVAKKIVGMLEALQDHDDVQEMFENSDIADSALES